MDRLHDHLLGRELEVDVLNHALERARLGGSQFVIVAGEAGIGKSRLLGHVADLASRDDWLVLRGRGAEFEGDLPFGVIIDALDAYLGTLSEGDRGRLSTDRLGPLAAVFPALSELGHAVDDTITSSERFRIYRTVADLLERLAARLPVLLVLDDLQWADLASLELVAHLVRRPPDAAVALIVGIRTGYGTDDAHRMIANIERSESMVRLDLEPLGRHTVAQLLDVDASTFEELYRLSGGNPFYALELARSGALRHGPMARHEVPGVVLRSIEAELDRLSRSAREAVAAAAVVGDPFDLDLTVAASGHGEGQVLTDLDELCLHQLVDTAAVPRQFQFRHPLIRNAVYEASPPGSRIASHRRIAEHLIARGAGPVELARHLEHSAHHGDLEAVRLLEQAGHEVAASAPESAARWLTSALALLPQSERVEHRIALLGELAMARGALGDFAAGLEALRQSLSIVPTTNRRAQTTLTIACSEGERLLGGPEQARLRLEQAYHGLEDQRSEDAVRLCVALSTNAMYLNDHSGMLEWAAEAGRVADELDDPALVVAARSAETSGAAFSGQVERALDLHQAVSPLLDALPDETVSNQLGVLCNLAAAELYLDLYRPALQHAERGLILARSSGQLLLMPVLSPIAGTSAWMLGEGERSDAILDDAVESARLANDPAGLAWHLFNRSLGALMGGDLEAALLLSGESMELSRSLEDGLITSFAAACRAQVLHEAGEPGEALSLILERTGGEELTGIGGGWRGIYFELLVRCHLSLGDPEQAARAATRARRHADDSRLGIAAMAAARAEALVALEAGDATRAIEAAASSVANAEAIGSPVHVATSKALSGRTLAASGQPEAAVDVLHQAADSYEVLGAIRYRDQTEAVLRQLGQTIHRRSQRGQGSGIGSLTGRELEVAYLVYDRLTNREIAEQLFLSLKTVETHLRNIFHKLGVTNRVDVARQIAEHRSVG